MSGTVEYVPVTLNAIQVDTIVGCDLFFTKRHKKKRFVTFYIVVERMSLNRTKLRICRKNHIKRLFVRKGDQKIYLKYVESSLKHIINDNRVDIKEKAYVVCDVAKNIMNDVFEDPRSGEKVERSKIWVSNTIDFIIRSKGSFSSLLGVVSYDYYTYTHSVNVSVLGLLFAKYLGFDGGEMQVFGTGLLLHDVGKNAD